MTSMKIAAVFLIVVSLAAAQDVKRPTAELVSSIGGRACSGGYESNSVPSVAGMYDAAGEATPGTFSFGNRYYAKFGPSHYIAQVIYGWQGPAGSYSTLTLKIVSSCSIYFGDSSGGCGLAYSSDGGSSWTILHQFGPWSVTTDVISLPASLSLSNLQVGVCSQGESAGTFDNGYGTLTVWDIRTEGIGTSPSAPSGLAAISAANGRSITLSWTDTASNETSYGVDYCAGVNCSAWSSLATGLPANTTSYTHSDLTPGAAYTYRVYAANFAGSSYSASSSATLPTVPNPPSGMSANPSSTATYIDLAWTDNASNETGHNVESCSGWNCTNFTSLISLGAGATSYRHNGLTPNTFYNYRTSATNAVGSSAYSNVAQAILLPPAAPTDLRAVPATSGSYVDLTWTDNANNETGYSLDRCTGQGCADFSALATLGANATSYRDAGLVPGATYNYRVYATHSAFGNSGYSNSAQASVVHLPNVTTIWNSSAVPVVADAGPDSAVELGVKFRSDVAGTITGIRFYKGPNNMGLHIGNLWSNAGTLLATVTFGDETVSGWQQATFSAPVAINANTTYVVSYFTPTGHYAFDSNYFLTTGTDNAPLHALANGVDGSNGVFVYGNASSFPNQSSQATNYWVDVVFVSASVGPTIMGISPSSGLAGTLVTISGANFGSTGTVTFNGTTATSIPTWTTTSITAVVPSGAATGDLIVTVGGIASNKVPFTVKVCPCTVWGSSAAPTMADVGPDSALEVGLKFRSDVAGVITGVRFYKSANNTGTHIGNLWSSTGTLLATVAFTGETASGWQQASFSSPVVISANTTYVVSYFVPSGHYAFDASFFSRLGIDSPPLHALKDGSEGGNGVFSYGGASVFPSLSYQGGNYWVDVVFINADSTTPLITHISPPWGPVGTPVTVLGSNFGAGGTLTFNGTAAKSISHWTANEIAAIVPDGATTGPVLVTVSGTRSNDLSFTVKACPCTIWNGNAVPAVADTGPDSSVELGVKFRSDLPGVITGVRFYKGESNTGTHIGNLWSSNGTLLGTATFSGETATGWQQANFTTPVAIAANVTYIVSYFAPLGHFSMNDNYFATSATDSPPLHALANGADGGNGLFAYGSGSTFPSQSFQARNYWMDVVFNTAGPTLVSLVVMPVNPSIITGTTQQFTAVGTYSDGSTQDLTATVTWVSTAPSVAPINSKGMVTAASAGSTSIQAILSTVNGSTGLVVIQPPTITAISPNSGPIGQLVTITGRGFGPDRGPSQVLFNGAPAPDIATWSDSRIVVSVPSTATTGIVGVVVNNRTSNGFPFTVTAGEPVCPASVRINAPTENGGVVEAMTQACCDKRVWPRGWTDRSFLWTFPEIDGLRR